MVERLSPGFSLLAMSVLQDVSVNNFDSTKVGLPPGRNDEQSCVIALRRCAYFLDFRYPICSISEFRMDWRFNFGDYCLLTRTGIVTINFAQILRRFGFADSTQILETRIIYSSLAMFPQEHHQQTATWKEMI